ncbi:MAG: hypothetical protein WCZ23_10500 [Rhodospirillaceae bacterium]
MHALPILATVIMLTATTATFAQDQSKTAGDALARDPAVVESQGPMPDETGTRAPESQETETHSNPLVQAWRAVTQAPPDLQGKPIKRPNDMAAEPVAHTQKAK